MNPAQKALQEKLAKMRQAKAGSTGQAPASLTEEKKEEVKNEIQQQTETRVETGDSIPEVKQVLETPDTKGESISIPDSQMPESKGTDHPIKMQLAELELALNQKLPEFKTILRDIHTKLRNDPEIVTALSDEEIGQILTGLKHHAQVEIIAPKAAKESKKATKAAIANMTADDL